MNQLLSELVQAPPFMYGILIGMTIIVFILTHLTTRYDKKYPYDANRYTLPVLYLIIFTMGVCNGYRTSICLCGCTCSRLCYS